MLGIAMFTIVRSSRVMKNPRDRVIRTAHGFACHRRIRQSKHPLPTTAVAGPTVAPVAKNLQTCTLMIVFLQSVMCSLCI